MPDTANNSFPWTCPLCGEALIFTSQYHCCNGHSFDRAREGYVNLLPAQHKRSVHPGDSKAMLQHRRAFLEHGYYQPLADRIAEACSEQAIYTGASLRILDAGCGEGYYIQQVKLRLDQDNSEQQHQLGGIDIAKDAIRMAAKRFPNIAFSVASSARIPVATHTMDIILRIFAPGTASEVVRCLKPGGLYLTVTPGPGHLLQLREMIYDQPTQHEIKPEILVGLQQEQVLDIEYPLHLDNQEDIANLFSMTPYYWQTSSDKQQQILSLETLQTMACFRLTWYRAQA